MHVSKSLLKTHQPLSLQDLPGDGTRKLTCVILQQSLGQFPQSFLAEPLCFRVDRDDPVEIERILFHLSIHHLHIGMMDLSLSVKPFDLSRENQPVSLLEAGPKIPFIAPKPLQHHLAASIRHDGFETPPPLMTVIDPSR